MIIDLCFMMMGKILSVDRADDISDAQSGSRAWLSGPICAID